MEALLYFFLTIVTDNEVFDTTIVYPSYFSSREQCEQIIDPSFLSTHYRYFTENINGTILSIDAQCVVEITRLVAANIIEGEEGSS
jgi:hypothetical protein